MSVPADAAVAASFSIASRGAEGWTLTVPAAVSATLSPGAYLADARLVVAGGVIVTESVALRLRDSVSV